MLHRRVYEAVGGYDGAFPMCNDFDYWLRAARTFRFRHVAGGPLILYRRHGANFSDESHRAQELNEVEAALRKNLADWPLDDLVPELDWAVLPRQWAERRACLVLAEAFAARDLPRARLRVASPRRPGAARAVAPRSPGVRAAHRALVVRVRRCRRRHDRARATSPRSSRSAATR